MKAFRSQFTPAQISSLIPGEYIERDTVVLSKVSELAEADRSCICFYQNPRFFEVLQKSQAGLIFVPIDFDPGILPAANLFRVENPYIYFMMLVQKWLELEEYPLDIDRDDSVIIAETAEIDKDVEIGANTVIWANVRIGKGSRIGSNCVIGKNCVIGQNCRLYPNVTIYEDTKIGNNVVLHSGVVLGADGFGFLLHKGRQFKLPQVGNVIIHSDVEIGANSCVDRATLGSTVIGTGTKIDNLVQIGHNCVIGEQSIICAQVGLAGNTKIGDRVYLAGQVGAAGHITIEDDVMVGAQSGVAGNVKAGSKLLGYPARDAGLAKRIMAAEKSLPEIVKYFRKIIRDTK
jgi:UDP-3-O-[3-hydroxymyristoyl] glucosamine N-acyltransferase